MGLLLFLIIILLFIIFRPYIYEWFRGFMARRAEDMVRRMAGMPSRKEEQRRRRQQQKEASRQQASRRHGSRGQYGGRASDDGLNSMREYAEDVEFTEIKEYSETTILEEDSKGSSRIYHESQVSDVEFTETKS